MAGLEERKLDALLRALVSVGAELSLPLLMTLVAVSRSPGLSINELAERIEIPQQTASRYVAILQGRYQTPGSEESPFARNPLITLEVSTDDPRRRALFLTSRGRAKLSNIINALYTK
jgi:DNA-binding MarR family transcriptional regulator